MHLNPYETDVVVEVVFQAKTTMSYKKEGLLPRRLVFVPHGKPQSTMTFFPLTRASCFLGFAGSQGLLPGIMPLAPRSRGHVLGVSQLVMGISQTRTRVAQTRDGCLVARNRALF